MINYSKITNAPGRYKYVLPNKDRKITIAISPETHLALKLYAQGEGFSITEATQTLLKYALEHIKRKRK